MIKNNLFWLIVLNELKMYTLSNDFLEISVKAIGAELCKIASVKNSNQFMWDAKPDVWGSFAPNLFPIIGCLKNNEYFFNNQRYTMPKHGFIRHNKDIELIFQTDNKLVFSLKYSHELLKLFPFKFEFLISYTLNENSIEINYTVKNLDDKTMYFSLGGHPALKCPLYEDEKYSDYSLVFEKDETSKSYVLNLQTGLVTDQTKTAFDTENTIRLRPDLFNNDALIFKDLKSRKVSLVSKANGEIACVTYRDFNYLGLWAKPNANYICIEPWLGIADSENTTQALTKKEAIIALSANETFNASYSIQIHERHLG